MPSNIPYTSTLPAELIQLLNEFSEKLKVPKNKLIEKSLRLYLEKLKQLEYVHSFKRASQDEDMLRLAEEGLKSYLDSLDVL
ncbi:MAG: ribbon-helix-helix domain-containing protein [Bacteroidetes bacterium]|nr:MAG: ribbon-helix-helix domain-containing protein [Bacteroidota bacterium]